MALISAKEMEELARTSRIAMREDEIEYYRQMLDGMISFASVLEHVNGKDCEGITVLRMTEEETPWREDRVKESLSQKIALSQSSETEDGFFRVPRTVGD